MRSTVVFNVVGLTPALVGEHTPNLQRLAQNGGLQPIRAVTPAVTCAAQATYLTGSQPSQHGIVGNGWFFRDLSEIWFWRQSNKLVDGEWVWETAHKRNSDFTCANLFWWYNMYLTADIGVTPRPMYPADGRKIPDCYAKPAELRDELTAKLGRFPLFKFWGPMTDISSSQWIADCALHVLDTRRPTLTLVYFPHLDYNLQRLGPDHPGIAKDLAEVDTVCGQVIERAEQDGARIVVLSEYGITPVSRPIHVNRALRQAGHIQVREEMGRELLDPGACSAFAVADHQIAHIYVPEQDRLAEVKALIEALPGVETVLDAETKPARGLDHERAGDLVAVAEADSWFTYYYWLDDARCPDFARTVEIHRKPGYDPVELFLDPALPVPMLSVAWRLLKKVLGFRTLMDVIPLDATLVKGSHGRPTDRDDDGPVFISSDPRLAPNAPVEATDVKDLILRHIFE
ncbi:MAG: alkaline phosphatase family protein [Rhodospirillaceae bacterium]|jgi:predicted AlkP superfamily pyrophosphatase or phosphodiesterase|nr:alkaline phosphatase family protein [Rhodospirillaceae bacterium]